MTVILHHRRKLTVYGLPITKASGGIPHILIITPGAISNSRSSPGFRWRVASDWLVLRWTREGWMIEVERGIRERKWHPSQWIVRNPNGGLILELTVNTFRELINWICSWGPLIEVLEPEDLRENVARTFRDAAGMYEKGRWHDC